MDTVLISINKAKTGIYEKFFVNILTSKLKQTTNLIFFGWVRGPNDTDVHLWVAQATPIQKVLIKEQIAAICNICQVTTDSVGIT